MQESIVPAIYDRRRLDEVLNCSDEDAFNTTRDLAIREGIFSGISSGAAVWGEIQVAKDLPRGLTVVTLLPDRGDRYLSTEVFRSICAACPPRRRRSLFSLLGKPLLFCLAGFITRAKGRGFLLFVATVAVLLAGKNSFDSALLFRYENGHFVYGEPLFCDDGDFEQSLLPGEGVRCWF